VHDKEIKPFFRSPAYYRRIRDVGAERRSKNKAVRGEALRLINSEMISAGIEHPPADLVRFAQHLGVHEIRFIPLVMRGRLVMEGRRLVAEVNEDLNDLERQRTVAHELAHVVLERERIAQATTVGQNVSRVAGNNLIEKLCDICGDEILLPREWLRVRLSNNDASLGTLLEIASSSNLSVDFVLARVIELRIKSWRAIWCMNVSDKAKILRSMPYWSESFLPWIDVEDNPTSPLRKCLETGDLTRGQLALLIEGERQPYFAECMRTGRDVVLCLLSEWSSDRIRAG